MYWGERGSFRGFIAAQEGWLTEGESGITGQSIAVIFEFPKEERRGKRTVRRKVPADPSRLVQSPPGTSINGYGMTDRATAESVARNEFINNPPTFDWEQLAEIAAPPYCHSRGYPRVINVATIPFDHTVADPSGWDYTEDLDSRPNYHTFAAYQTRQWTATCVKRERRR